MKRLLDRILLAACLLALTGADLRAADAPDGEEKLDTKTYDVSFLHETATDPPLGRGPIWECWPWPQAQDRPPARDRGFLEYDEKEWVGILDDWLNDEREKDPDSVQVRFLPPRRFVVKAQPYVHAHVRNAVAFLKAWVDRSIRLEIAWIPMEEAAFRALVREHAATFPAIPEGALGSLVEKHAGRARIVRRTVFHGDRVSAEFNEAREADLGFQDVIVPRGIAYEATAKILPDIDAVAVEVRLELAGEEVVDKVRVAGSCLSIRRKAVIASGFGVVLGAIFPGPDCAPEFRGILVARAAALPFEKPPSSLPFPSDGAIHIIDATELARLRTSFTRLFPVLESSSTRVTTDFRQRWSPEPEEGVIYGGWFGQAFAGDWTDAIEDLMSVAGRKDSEWSQEHKDGYLLIRSKAPLPDTVAPFFARERARARRMHWVDLWIAEMSAARAASLPASGELDPADIAALEGRSESPDLRVLASAGTAVSRSSMHRDWNWIGGIERRVGVRREPIDAGLVAYLAVGTVREKNLWIQWDIENRIRATREDEGKADPAAFDLFVSSGDIAIREGAATVAEARSRPSGAGRAVALILRARPIEPPR
ncbi:MAG: hypothetical protein JXP34_04235 [Planctomycetes bacterium]|nr:hypothetical protein [Planctomycetota bacterium]